MRGIFKVISFIESSLWLGDEIKKKSRTRTWRTHSAFAVPLCNPQQQSNAATPAASYGAEVQLRPFLSLPVCAFCGAKLPKRVLISLYRCCEQIAEIDSHESGHIHERQNKVKNLTWQIYCVKKLLSKWNIILLTTKHVFIVAGYLTCSYRQLLNQRQHRLKRSDLLVSPYVVHMYIINEGRQEGIPTTASTRRLPPLRHL